MGFNKTFLPSPEEIQRRYDKDPDGTYRWLRKSDAFIGGAASMPLVNDILTNHKREDGIRKQNREGQ